MKRLLRNSFFSLPKLFVGIILMLLVTFIIPSVVFAAASPSPTIVPPSDAQTTENLKERIDNVIKNRTDQVKGVLDEMTLRKRGFIGEVERVIEKSVTVKNGKGTEVLTVDENVVVMRDNKKATIDDIAVGDWVIALGYGDAEDFSLRRLVVSSTSLLPKTYDTTIGTVVSVTKTQVNLSPRTGAEPIAYQINKTTHYENALGATIKATDVKKDSQFLIISYTDQDKKIATFIKSLAATTNGQ